MATVSSEAVLLEAVRAIRSGGVIAYPTEYCYGLGCDPDCIPAIRRILDIKRRDRGQGLVLIAADINQLKPWVDLTDRSVRERVQATWPGPVTWVVPSKSRASPWLRGGHDNQAVRVTAHPLAVALCRHAQMPLVSTSANRSGRAELCTEYAVRRGLAGIDYVVPGEVGELSGPTIIRDATTGDVIRGAGRPGKRD